MKRPILSIVIPAFNEEGRLEATLPEIAAYLTERSLTFEMIVVDDGSSDETSQVAHDFAKEAGELWTLRVLRNQRNRGKGFSVKRGMLEARGRFALMTDADLSTPICEMEKLEREVVDGKYQIAIGSRDMDDSQVEVRQSMFREASGKLFNRLMRSVSGLPYADTQCGFKLFEVDPCRRIFEMQIIEGFGFDVEILYVARKLRLRVKEVPVVWRNAQGSKVGVFSGLEAMGDLFSIRRYDWAGWYDSNDDGGRKER